MFARIRWRLVAWAMLVFGLLLAVVGAAVYLTLARSLAAEVDSALRSRGDQEASNLHELAEGAQHLQSEGYAGGRFALLVGSDGRVLADPQRLNVTRLPLAGPAGNRPFLATVTIGSEPDRLYIRPLAGAAAGQTLLVVGQSLAAEQQALHRLLAVILAVGGAGLLLAVAGAWFLAGRALVPIQVAFARQREFVADASHELRTPLTVLRAATDLLYQRRERPFPANDALLADVRREINRLERLAGDLLLLARSDLEQLALAVAEVDLAALAADTVRRLSPLAQHRGLRLRVAGDAGTLPVEGDPDRLDQVLLILLDNALKYTPAGGEVVVEARRQGHLAVLLVRDTGVGIAPEHLERIFDRFYRVDAARSREQEGTGLGLAIARTLVAAHSGELTLASAPGAGTAATIRLPLVNRPGMIAERWGDWTARLPHHAPGGRSR